MGTRSQDQYPRGTRVRDRPDPASCCTPELERRYGPLEVIDIPAKKEKSK